MQGRTEELKLKHMANERRVKSRYPIAMKVRYQTMEPSGLVSGVGQTINLSSNGMHVACNSNIPEGTRIKTYVEWPSLLNGTTPLQLITIGTVVRRTTLGISIAFESYQFKTMSRIRSANVTEMPQRIAAGYSNPEPQSLALAKASS
jgi:hypothetical protein